MEFVPTWRPQRELPSHSTTWKYSEETAVCDPGVRPSLDIKSASTWILTLPTSINMKNKCLLFKPPCLWCFCHSSLNRLRHAETLSQKVPICTSQLHNGSSVWLKRSNKVILASHHNLWPQRDSSRVESRK